MTASSNYRLLQRVGGVVQQDYYDRSEVQSVSLHNDSAACMCVSWCLGISDWHAVFKGHSRIGMSSIVETALSNK